jgi:predicted restriction endonuclease
MKEISQRDLLIEFFKNNPHRNIFHPEIVDWAMEEYKKRTGKIFRDPDRGIRKLHQEGLLVKIDKGIYKYDPDLTENKILEDFTAEQREIILKRDGYKCVICGKGRKEGVELHVDHIKPKDKGGKAVLENGQVLCAQHNFLKKNLNQTETGKKMFIRLYEVAKAEGNQKIVDFCIQILETFEKHNINGHIKWNR